MKVGGPIKLVSQLLDLPIIDIDERWCGIVDDVEFAGSAGKEMRIKALLVGPGAYAGRMPNWLFWIVQKTAGDRIARVPADILRIRMMEFKTEQRPSTIMARIAKGYSDEQIAAISDYLGSLK